MLRKTNVILINNTSEC